MVANASVLNASMVNASVPNASVPNTSVPNASLLNASVPTREQLMADHAKLMILLLEANFMELHSAFPKADVLFGTSPEPPKPPEPPEEPSASSFLEKAYNPALQSKVRSSATHRM